MFFCQHNFQKIFIHLENNKKGEKSENYFYKFLFDLI